MTDIKKDNRPLEKFKVDLVDINSIKANDYNPNRQSEEDFQLLLKSITEDGFTQPIVVIAAEESGYIIVDGEHRLIAAKQLGYTEIPVVVAPMTAEQAKIATIRHNRT